MERAMDVFDVIYARRAVREYTADAIDDETLRKLIDAAVQAPSAVNQQPWAFFVVRDDKLLDRISRGAKAGLLESMTTGSAVSRFGELLRDPEFNIFYNAPVLVVIAGVERSDWDVEDCALAAANLMLAARARGLGTCWIGFAQAWLGTPEGKAALQMPPDYFPVAPVIVGHPTSFPPAVPRKTPEVHFVGR